MVRLLPFSPLSFFPWPTFPPTWLELPGVFAPRQMERGGRPIFTVQVKAESQIVCTGEAPSSLLPSLPDPSGWGCRCVYLVGGDGDGWWAAVWKLVAECGVPMGS